MIDRVDAPGGPEAAQRHALSIVVTASQGCDHAAGVVGAVRAQLGPTDELLVLEPFPCARRCPSSAERHLSVDSADEFRMRVRGIAETSRACLLVLEDHTVPSHGFLDTLRHLLASEPGRGSATFFVANGTPDSRSSRALFLFVHGDAMPDRHRPSTTSSSFALAGETLTRTRSMAQRGELAPGTVEYAIVPNAIPDGPVALTLDLVLTHHQRCTLAEALCANYLNSRVLGDRERSMVTISHGVRLTVHRYLYRVATVLRDHADARRLPVHLLVIGSAAFGGWWLGRWAGAGDSAERLSRVHRNPAVTSVVMVSGTEPGTRRH